MLSVDIHKCSGNLWTGGSDRCKPAWSQILSPYESELKMYTCSKPQKDTFIEIVAFYTIFYAGLFILPFMSVTWTVGLSAPSAGLTMTPSCVVQSTHWTEGMPSRGTWIVLRGGPVRTSWNSTRPSARSCTWVRAIPSTNTGWVKNRLRAAVRRTWGCWLMRNSTWPGSVHLQPRRPTASWAAWKETWPAGQGRWFCPSALL